MVVAAGGLGTQVPGLVDGQPGIVRLPGEISALSRARVVVVYNPCYEPFIR